MRSRRIPTGCYAGRYRDARRPACTPTHQIGVMRPVHGAEFSGLSSAPFPLLFRFDSGAERSGAPPRRDRARECTASATLKRMRGLDRNDVPATRIPLRLLKKTERSTDIPAKTPKRSEERSSDGVRCPVCYWQPPSSSRWACHGPDPAAPSFVGCGTVWNTFSTHGVCPGCSHRRHWTKCLFCLTWSLHDDWYERK
jgi:hypothetical protein